MNKITGDSEVPTIVGPKIYSLLRDLHAPTLPEECTKFEKLKGHFNPKPLVIAERYRFHQRSQRSDESIAEYLADLRRLATHCEFGNFLNDALRDRLVCGLRSEAAQKRLLAEPNLTLARALELSQGMEAASKSAKTFQTPEASIKALTKTDGQSRSMRTQASRTMPCFRCGRTNHKPFDCRFLSAACHNCGRTGHIAPVRRSPKKTSSRSRAQRTAQILHEEEVEDDEEEDDVDDLSIKRISSLSRASSQGAIMIDLKLNDTPVKMELDTGAAVSLISEATKNQLFPTLPLAKSNALLRTYSGERLKVHGQLNVKVCYGDQNKELPLLVVDGNGQNLLG